MSSLTPAATDRARSLSIGTPAERAHQLVQALVALAQLERDLQRLSRALALSVAPAQPPRGTRIVRWPRVRRDSSGYPAM